MFKHPLVLGPRPVRFALSAAAGCLIATTAAESAVNQLRGRLVNPSDPAQAGGVSGPWRDNGYDSALLNTWRVYAVSNIADEILAVGDQSDGLPVMSIATSDGSSLFNATGALGNNGLRRPTDLTAIPGLSGYTSQWDSFLAVSHSHIYAFAPGLATALGATLMGAGGLDGGSFWIEDTGWFIVPTGVPNTIYNPATGDHEALVMQLSVPAGISINLQDATVVALSTGVSDELSFITFEPPPEVDLAEPASFEGVGDAIMHTTGDFNGDGSPDVATIVPESSGGLQQSGAVQIFLNQGTSQGSGPEGNWLGLSPRLPTFPTGIGPADITAGYFDLDAHLDLAVANLGDDTVTILLGQGDGTFATAATLGVADEPRALAAADVTGSAPDELAVAHRAGDFVAILENTAPAPGTTAFRLIETLLTSPQPVAIELEDMDDDTNIDLVVANAAAGTVQVFLLENGIEQSSEEIPVGAMPGDLATGDIDSNGLPDIVTVIGGEERIALVLNDGGAVFRPPFFEPVGSAPSAIDLGDLDADGDLDMVALATDREAGRVVQIVQSLFHTGAGLDFLAAVSHPVEEKASVTQFVAVADMDLDSLPDVIASNAKSAGNASVSVFLTLIPCPADVGDDETVGFKDLVQILIRWGPCPPAPATCPEDLDGDGIVDNGDLQIVLEHWGVCTLP